MTDVVSILLSTMLVTNALVSATRPVPATPGGLASELEFSVTAPLPIDPLEDAYQRLLKADDDAQEAVDKWIREADEKGGAEDEAALRKRILERFAEVEREYRAFLGKHPNYVRARIAFGSFLNDTGQEFAAREQWEKSLELDPTNPAVHNNLAGVYAHSGPVTNAFRHFEKALELSPKEPLYHQNFATCVFLFRKDVMEYYGFTNEQQVFDKSLDLYRKAQELEPRSFLIATDLAQTYYLIKPPRHDDALSAWRHAFELASDDLEREGVRVHLGRILVQAGRFDEARRELSLVTNANFGLIKGKILKTLEAKAQGKNAELPPFDPAELRDTR